MTSSHIQPVMQPRQSLARWTLAHVAGLLLGAGALFLAISFSILDQQFDAIDEQQYRQDLIRVSLILKQDQSALEDLLRDYAYWDETYSAVKTRSQEYMARNFTPDSLVNLRINTVLLLDINGQELAGLSLAPDGSLAATSPGQRPTPIPFFSVQSLNSTAGHSTQLQWLNQEPVLILISKITDTARMAPANGYMVLIRNWDAAYLKKLRLTTSVDFSLKLAPAEGGVRYSALQQSNYWDATQNLSDSPAALEVSGPTRLQAQRTASILALLANAAALIGLSLLGVYMVLKKRVLIRLRTFSELADRHRLDRDRAIRWPVQGNDELDNLSLALNELMGEVAVRHAELSYQAQHDPLTRIGNRRMLMDRLEVVQSRCRRVPKVTSSLLVLDLDGFKMINDGMGHAVGDQVLQAVAERALAMVRNYDIATRLGGDEFAILLEDADPEQVLPFANRLLHTIEAPITCNGQDIVIRASVGIASVDGTLSNEDVLRNADLAMYEAKRRGKGKAAIFNSGLLDAATRRSHLEQQLQRAMDSDQLEVWFQPVVEPFTGRVKGMEALTRWPLDGDYVAPIEFIPIAEANGMIVQLGRLVFAQVGAAMVTLRTEYPTLTCSINLSMRQFRDTDLVAEVLEFSRTHSLPAKAVHWELTESMVAEADDDILPAMRELVGQGYCFHLDDFGTGYSSLARLRQLPFDTLKIDRSFVTPLNSGDDVMASNIIGMARSLGMDVIAEGVETQVELNRLVELGCTKIQGYYFARPMPLHQLRNWLNAQQSTREYDKE